jgi:excinuclease ABC subunit A
VAAGTPETIAATAGSLTGSILQGLLAAGPFAERPKYDREAAARQALAEAKAATLADIKSTVKAPWQIDGRRWHLHDRVGRSGRPARWEGRLLERVVDRIEELADFLPTDWSQRTAVRIVASKELTLPFFHATTSGEWIVTLRFNVPRNTFKAATLARELALVPFHQGETPVHSDAARLSVTNQGAIQEIVLNCHLAADLETPAFDAFLVKAVAAHRRIGQSGELVVASELS